MAPVEEQLVPLAAEEMEVEYWAGEPSTLEELLDQYVVESKFASQCPGGTLYLTAASNRKGEANNCLPNQRYKLWFVLRRNYCVQSVTSHCMFD